MYLITDIRSGLFNAEKPLQVLPSYDLTVLLLKTDGSPEMREPFFMWSRISFYVLPVPHQPSYTFRHHAASQKMCIHNS